MLMSSSSSSSQRVGGDGSNSDDLAQTGQVDEAAALLLASSGVGLGANGVSSSSSAPGSPPSELAGGLGMSIDMADMMQRRHEKIESQMMQLKRELESMKKKAAKAEEAAASVSAAPPQTKRAALVSLSQNTYSGAGTAKAKAPVSAVPPSVPAPPTSSFS